MRMCITPMVLMQFPRFSTCSSLSPFTVSRSFHFQISLLSVVSWNTVPLPRGIDLSLWSLLCSTRRIIGVEFYKYLWNELWFLETWSHEIFIYSFIKIILAIKNWFHCSFCLKCSLRFFFLFISWLRQYMYRSYIYFQWSLYSCKILYITYTALKWTKV